jgi:hypothetical protein
LRKKTQKLAARRPNMSLTLLTVRLRDEILFFLSGKLLLLKMYHRQRGKAESFAEHPIAISSLARK